MLLHQCHEDFKGYIKEFLPKDLIILDDLNQADSRYPLIIFKMYSERIFEDSFLNKIKQIQMSKFFFVV